MVVLVGMAALSVDVAYMNLSRAQLRAATDAAARAGGEALSRAQSISVARQTAKDVAAKNLVAGDPLLLEDSNIVFGNSAENSNGTWAFTANETPTNSVQVVGQRTRFSAGGSIGLFFGRIFNVYQFEPSLTATVVKLDRDICLVLDRSSSMKLDLATDAPTMSTADPRFALKPNKVNSRWAALSDAVDEFADAIDGTPQNEQVSVASFGSDCTYFSVTNLVSKTDQPLTTNTSTLNNAVNYYSKIIFNGSTNTAAGIDQGKAALTDPIRARPFSRKVMVFMTDGFRTQGRDPVFAAQEAAAQGVVIYTVTFGATFDHSEMIAVANATGGEHYHAPNSAALTQIFRQIAQSTNVILTQ